ncbi:hypothetical protein SAMN06309944_2095 [Micrococcales bacterium KH10]|nr:hypothetical protein SAMN06309944_2095 [Micrococcales bacterium KH10]
MDEAVQLHPEQWQTRAQTHQLRADALTSLRRERIATGGDDEVEDFLFTYYPVRPGKLRQWHPGIGVTLIGSLTQLQPWVQSRWYRTWSISEDEHCVAFKAGAFMADRGEAVRWIRQVLSATAERDGYFGCFGLHEWAMVYRQREHRHSLPLRLSQEETDAVVEASQIRCSHFDAFRFFTDEARPRNALQPSPQSRVELEQPACLHANMDLLRHAMKLVPAVPSDLLLDCFELARDIRVLDMEASPYDVSSRGYGTVAIETKSGRAAYIARQRQFADRAAQLRLRLVAVTELLCAVE